MSNSKPAPLALARSFAHCLTLYVVTVLAFGRGLAGGLRFRCWLHRKRHGLRCGMATHHPRLDTNLAQPRAMQR